MIFPNDIEQKLGFDKIKALLEANCLSDLGREFVNKMSFTSNYTQLHKLLNQTDEFKKLLLQKEPFPKSNYFDIRDHLKNAGVVNTWLTEEELHEIGLVLNTIEKSISILKKNKEEFPSLFNLAEIVKINPAIRPGIESILDERGQIRNNASEELQKIRKSIIHDESKVRTILDKILRNAVKKGFTPEDISVTIRSGRLVIPVKSEYKRLVKGFIHDESASGQTCYIEPTEALEINNDIRDLQYSEKREIIRILTSLTDQIRPEIPTLKKACQYLGVIDFIRAKAKLALMIDGVLPVIQKQPVIDWENANHPLLMLALEGSTKEIVPLTITLQPERKILIISGPNAGGKSVCLKTIGLLQYMLQCGLLVPVSEGSRMGVFSRVFIDIGDEQSIENDLSTYSSHLINMKFFLSNANKNTLFLIDEFGTGTEPQFGAAIAESVLMELRKLKAWGVVTTHYVNLKKYGEKTPGVVNGAMRFDMENLEPTFILDIGRPGSSFAIEIANKIGLPSEVLENAKQKAGYDQIKFDKLINQLEQEKSDLQKQIKKNKEKEDHLEKTTKEYESLKSYLKEREENIIEEARIKAEQLFKEANSKIENTIRIIKEEKAEKTKTQKVRKELEQFKDKIIREKKIVGEKAEKSGGTMKKGDYAKIKDSNSSGRIIEIKGDTAILEIGEIRSHIALSRLDKINQLISSQKKQKNAGSNKQDILRAKMISFKPILDIRGKRVEEIHTILENFIDDAIMTGTEEVKILHGKGDGILRSVVREQLRHNPSIEKAVDEHIERGGAGITVVILK